jgi:hypothetical protein
MTLNRLIYYLAALLVVTFILSWLVSAALIYRRTGSLDRVLYFLTHYDLPGDYENSTPLELSAVKITNRFRTAVLYVVGFVLVKDFAALLLGSP